MFPGCVGQMSVIRVHKLVTTQHPPQQVSFSIAGGRLSLWGTAHQRVPVIVVKMCVFLISPGRLSIIQGQVVAIVEPIWENLVFAHFLNHICLVVLLITGTVAVARHMCRSRRAWSNFTRFWLFTGCEIFYITIKVFCVEESSSRTSCSPHSMFVPRFMKIRLYLELKGRI